MNKSHFKISYLAIILIMILFISLGLLGTNKTIVLNTFNQILENNKENENELSGGFPYTIDFLDYNITINSVKVFEDYALFDYSVKKIDGGYINTTDVNITGNVNFKGKEFYISSNDVERRWEYSSVRIISTGEIIAKENKDSPANLSFSINARSDDRSYLSKHVSIKEEVYLTDEDYVSFNKKINFDNIDFEIRSLANFEFGSLMYIFVGNKNEEDCKRIASEYGIKLKSEDYEETFDLEKWVGFTDIAIKKYSS